MKIKNITQLLSSDFDLKNISVYRFSVEPGHTDINSYLKNGRNKNLLHFILKGNRSYKIGERTFTVPVGSVIFIPDKTQYVTESFLGEEYEGIGISFDVTEQYENLLILPDIYYEWNVNLQRISEAFFDIEKSFGAYPEKILILKAKLYEIMHLLFLNHSAVSQNHILLKPALKFIAEHYTENLPVSVYAEACRLSESYFRSIFSEYMGMSPIDYRNMLRFNEAKRLYQQRYNLQEIAEKIGFNDAGYLSKLYKRKMGLSLKRDSGIV